MVDSPEELAEKLRLVRYLPADEMLPVIHQAIRMNRPLLIEGPPESGKTELAMPSRRRQARSSNGSSVTSGSTKKRPSASSTSR